MNFNNFYSLDEILPHDEFKKLWIRDHMPCRMCPLFNFVTVLVNNALYNCKLGTALPMPSTCCIGSNVPFRSQINSFSHTSTLTHFPAIFQNWFSKFFFSTMKQSLSNRTLRSQMITVFVMAYFTVMFYMPLMTIFSFASDFIMFFLSRRKLTLPRRVIWVGVFTVATKVLLVSLLTVFNFTGHWGLFVNITDKI